MLFLAEVIITSGFSCHLLLGFTRVCQKWRCSTYVHYFLRPRNHACYLWKSTDILFLSEVITAAGFGRDSDTILVTWHRHVPYVVDFVFLEFVDTYMRSLSISHTAVKYVRFILATAILDFWQMSTSCDTGSGIMKSLIPKTWG